MVSPPSKLKMFTGSVYVLLTSVSLKLITIKIKLIYATTSSWEKTKWRVNSKWRRLILFFFLRFELIFLWSELTRVQFYFILIFLFDPSRSELIRPGLAVRVDPVWLLYLPLINIVFYFKFILVIPNMTTGCCWTRVSILIWWLTFFAALVDQIIKLTLFSWGHYITRHDIYNIIVLCTILWEAPLKN